MYFDQGRKKDLDMLSERLKQENNPKTRSVIQKTIDGIRHQAQNERLGRERDELILLRQKMSNETKTAFANQLRDEADKLEQRINKEVV